MESPATAERLCMLVLILDSAGTFAFALMAWVRRRLDIFGVVVPPVAATTCGGSPAIC
jgi:uncharacterized membrane protein YeiH